MFPIEDIYKTLINIPVITGNYKVLHFDEHPILFAGTNDYGNKIIGSLAFEGDEEDEYRLRFFHIIVTDEDYIKFTRQKITYRQLIDGYATIFVVDTNLNYKPINIFQVPLENIPEEYLPIKEVYCPKPENVIGVEYTFSLKGGVADNQEGFRNVISEIAESMEEVICCALDVIRTDNSKAKIYQMAYSPGSFRINFRIDFNYQGLFFDAAPLNKFITDFIDFTINEPFGNIAQDQNINLHDSFDNAAKNSYLPIAKGGLERLKANAQTAPAEFGKISQKIGEGFEYIEVIATDKNNNESILGLINRESKELFNVPMSLIELSQVKDEVIEDETYQEYSIQIFNLSTNSGKGSASIKNKNSSGEEILDKPKIEIRMSGDLHNSIYTSSLDKGIWITVKAKATKTNGRFSRLKIEL